MRFGDGFKMSEEVYGAIAEADSGFVESPAGCGKTEAIVRTVGGYCTDMQLVLTHTHAGVDALRQRFRQHGVPVARYHIDTIAGWSWGWVRKYPTNARYEGTTDIANWYKVYAAMTALLDKDFVTRGILNSYAGIIVDEYQDCTLPMHALIARLNTLLPCRVLGDELQGIFDFDNEPLVGWADVRAEFRQDLGMLDTPHRWIRAKNRDLGQWLLDNRDAFRAGREPNYTGSPISMRSIHFADLAQQLVLPPSTVTQAARSSSTIGVVGSRLGTAHVIAPMLTNKDGGRHTNTSRKVSRRVASPACIAGVRVSRPNFRALCRRTKL